MTRFNSVIREHFAVYKNDKKKSRAKCNYCDHDCDDNATRLRFHIYGGKS